MCKQEYYTYTKCSHEKDGPKVSCDKAENSRDKLRQGSYCDPITREPKTIQDYCSEYCQYVVQHRQREMRAFTDANSGRGFPKR